MNLKVLNTVVWSWSSDQTEEERWQEGILGKQRLYLAQCAIRAAWKTPQRSGRETTTNLTATSERNIGVKLMASGELVLKQLRTVAQLRKSSKDFQQQARITLAELTSESKRGIASLKGWRSPELPQCQSTGAVKEEQALNEHHCMGCSIYRWRTELKNYCQDAAGGGKQWISLSSRRLDLDADADIVGLLMCLFSNWVACPPRGLEGIGLNSLLLRGRKQVWSKSLAPLPSVLLLGSTRLALPGRQDPQATSDVHVEPPPPHRLSNCSHHGLGTGLATFPTLHQTIPSDSSCSPKLGYFPWGLLSECQFFQVEAMPAFNFLFFPHTLTQALSVGSFV